MSNRALDAFSTQLAVKAPQDITSTQSTNPQTYYTRLVQWLQQVYSQCNVIDANQYDNLLNELVSDRGNVSKLTDWATHTYNDLKSEGKTIPNLPNPDQPSGKGKYVDSKDLLDAISKSDSDSILEVLEKDFGLSNIKALLERDGFGYESGSSFKFNSIHDFLDDLENSSLTTGQKKGDIEQIIDAINKSDPVTIRQAIKDLKVSPPTPPTPTSSDPIVAYQDILQDMQNYQTHMNDFWTTGLGKYLITHAQPPILPTDQQSYQKSVQWLGKEYSLAIAKAPSGAVYSFTTESAATQKKLIDSAGGTTPSSSLNPPPGYPDHCHPPELAQIYNDLNQLNAHQDWFKNWTGGQAYETPADLTKNIDQLKNDIASLKAQGVMGDKLTEMESLLTKDQQVLTLYQSLSTKTYTGPDGTTFQLQDTIFGNSKGSMDIIDLYNKAVSGDAAAMKKIESFISAYKQNASQIAKDTASATADKNALMLDLFDPGSTFHSDLIDILAKNPKIDTSSIDLTFLTGKAGANYVWAQGNAAIIKNKDAWIQYLMKEKGYDQATATKIATELTTVFQDELKTLYNKMLHTGYSTPQAVLADIRKAMELSQDPSKLSPDQINDLLYVVKTTYGDKTSPGNEINALNKEIEGYEHNISSLEYQLANDYATLKENEKTSASKNDIDALEKKIKQTLEEISTAKKGLQSIGQKLDALNTSFNALLDDTIMQIFDKGTFDQKDFNAKLSQIQTQVSSLIQDPSFKQVSRAYNDATTLINGQGRTGSLVDQMIQAVPSLKNKVIGKGDDKSFPNAAGGSGIWFDTSRIQFPNKPTKADLTNALDKYFAECMHNGITEAKLSFDQINSHGAGNTVEQLLKYGQEAGLTQAQTMQLIHDEAQTYGIKLGLSVGGEDAQGSGMKFPGDPKAYADSFYENIGKYCDSIDYDLEGSGLSDFIAQNGQANIKAFFDELHAKAQHGNVDGNSTSIQLTMAGSISNPKQLSFLFTNPSPIDNINVMAYNDGAGYYLSVDNADYGSKAWIDFLTQKLGISAKQAMGMLSFDLEDQTPYNSMDPQVTQSDPWPKQADDEIFKRTGKHLTEMTPGAAASELLAQLEIDTKKAYGLDPGDTSFGFSHTNWWIDSNRDPISSGSLEPYPEAEGSAEDIERKFNILPSMSSV